MILDKIRCAPFSVMKIIKSILSMKNYIIDNEN